MSNSDGVGDTDASSSNPAEPDERDLEESEAEPGSGPGAPPDTEEESAAEPGSGPGAPQR